MLRTRVLLCIGIGLALAGTRHASGQVSRLDLAVAVQQLEARLAQAPIDATAQTVIDRRFDQASVAFFAGRLGPALAAIHALSHDLRALSSEVADLSIESQTALQSLRVEMVPMTVCSASAEPARVRIRSLYLPDLEQDLALSVRLVLTGPGERRDLATCELSFRDGEAIDEQVAVAIDPSLAAGRYSLRVEGAGAASLDYPWFLVARSLDAVRVEQALRLDAIGAAIDPALRDAWQSCCARNRLLRDAVSPLELTRFLMDPAQWQAQVRAEIDALAAGRDPFAGGTGDLWREVMTPGGKLPFRIYVPALADDPAPLPVIIALHGAGGDENMFFAGYGAGRLLELAAQQHFIAIAPLTYAVGRDPVAALDALLRVAAQQHPIDPARVYVIGHSLGSALAATLVEQAPQRLAAAALLMGAGPPRSGPTIPTRVIAAQNDPIVPAGNARAQIEARAAAGAPITFELLAGRGHTLAVGDVLPDVVDWLLSQRRVTER